jgi:hypothetical protein
MRYCGRNHTGKKQRKSEIKNVDITGRIEVVLSIACKITKNAGGVPRQNSLTKPLAEFYNSFRMARRVGLDEVL